MITYAAVDYAFFALAMSPAAKGVKSAAEGGGGGGGGGGEGPAGEAEVGKDEPVYESLTAGKTMMLPLWMLFELQ